MTPERQNWWNSLSQEERRVRRDIKELRTQIKWHKIGLNLSCGHETEMRKFALRMNKRIIKALRKEIAMDVIALHNSAYEYYTCPYCGQNVKEGDVMRDEDNYCASCGQKLRWEQ